MAQLSYLKLLGLASVLSAISEAVESSLRGTQAGANTSMFPPYNPPAAHNGTLSDTAVAVQLGIYGGSILAIAAVAAACVCWKRCCKRTNSTQRTDVVAGAAGSYQAPTLASVVVANAQPVTQQLTHGYTNG